MGGHRWHPGAARGLLLWCPCSLGTPVPTGWAQGWLRAVVAEIGVAPALTLGETDSKQDPEQVLNHGRVAHVAQLRVAPRQAPPSPVLCVDGPLRCLTGCLTALRALHPRPGFPWCLHSRPDPPTRADVCSSGRCHSLWMWRQRRRPPHSHSQPLAATLTLQRATAWGAVLVPRTLLVACELVALCSLAPPFPWGMASFWVSPLSPVSHSAGGGLGPVPELQVPLHGTSL